MPTALVTGGRNFDSEAFVHLAMTRIWQRVRFTVLAHGDAPSGVDRFADRWARINPGTVAMISGYPVAKVDWDSYLGKRAGNRRNQRMLDQAKPHLGIVFPGGSGTRDMHERLQTHHVPWLKISRNGWAVNHHGSHARLIEEHELEALFKRPPA